MSLPEWTSAFVTLILNMTKEESDDYCQGWHIETYPSDSFVQNFTVAEWRFAELRRETIDRLSVELGPGERGWRYEILGVTRDGEVKRVAAGDYDGLHPKMWSYGPAFGAESFDDIKAWLGALHEEAAALRERRREERIAAEKEKRTARARTKAFRDLRSAIRTLGRAAVIEYASGTDLHQGGEK
jgi:hypothetical protein